jgi:hypothetical protein
MHHCAWIPGRVRGRSRQGVGGRATLDRIQARGSTRMFSPARERLFAVRRRGSAASREFGNLVGTLPAHFDRAKCRLPKWIPLSGPIIGSITDAIRVTRTSRAHSKLGCAIAATDDSHDDSEDEARENTDDGPHEGGKEHTNAGHAGVEPAAAPAPNRRHRATDDARALLRRSTRDIRAHVESPLAENSGSFPLAGRRGRAPSQCGSESQA